MDSWKECDDEKVEGRCWPAEVAATAIGSYTRIVRFTANLWSVLQVRSKNRARTYTPSRRISGTSCELDPLSSTFSDISIFELIVSESAEFLKPEDLFFPGDSFSLICVICIRVSASSVPVPAPVPIPAPDPDSAVLAVFGEAAPVLKRHRLVSVSVVAIESFRTTCVMYSR